MFLLWIFLLFGVQTSCALEYLGCYKSSESDSELSVLSSKDFGTPSGCIEECRSHYYMFAGMMAGQKCYCGSSYGRNGLSENCTMPCFNNASSMCGSLNAMSIYATGQKGPSPPRRVEAIHEGANALLVTWQPPDNPNGNLTSYTVRAVVIETHAFNPLPPVEIQVEGGSSNSTVLSGLQSGTKYNISITAKNLKGHSDPAFTTGWTLIGPPNKPETPKIIDTNGKTMTIQLSEGISENGPITFYQVVVVQPGVIPPSGPNIAYPSYDQSNEDDLGYYVTAEFDAFDFSKYQKFVIGDGQNIGGYFNAPLKEDSVLPQVGLVLVSRNRDSAQYKYSDLTSNSSGPLDVSQSNTTKQVLLSAIVIMVLIIILLILSLFLLRRRHQPGRREIPTEHQHLRDSPDHEMDNPAYIGDDVPETADHDLELQTMASPIPRNLINFEEQPFHRGRYGFIYRGTVQKQENKIPVSVQCIANASMKRLLKKRMLEELDTCIKAGSMQHLLRLVGTCEVDDSLLVVMEMPPETLKQRLVASRAGRIFPSEHFLRIASVIAQALQYLEERGCVHTRLCARSVGIYDDFTPKLMGPGIGLDTIENIKYTRWTAIECFGKRITHQPSVVWAFGVLLWEILSLGGTPYAHLLLDSDVEEAVQSGIRLHKLEDISDPLYEVMRSCWDVDDHERPTFDELTRLDRLTILPITVREEYNPTLEINA